MVFAAAAMALSLTGTLLLLLAADLVLHARAEKSAGVNRYGYRGPVVGRKQPGELRIVMAGGSTVFGYGVSWTESIPYVLEERLRQRMSQPVSVVNLGFNNEGAYAFLPNLEDYASLDYDVVVLYEGYNDLMGDSGANTSVYRRNSAVFRMFGYFPILPLYLDEKAKMLRHGGDLGNAYAVQRGEAKTVFRPNLIQRTSAGALDAAAAVTNALGDQLGRLSASASPVTSATSAIGCADPWVVYCDGVHAAIRAMRARGKGVVMVAQPLLVGAARPPHERQQAMLRAMMAREFSGDQGVRFVDLSLAVDLDNIDVSFDKMHLKPPANARIADALAPAVLELAARK